MFDFLNMMVGLVSLIILSYLDRYVCGLLLLGVQNKQWHVWKENLLIFFAIENQAQELTRVQIVNKHV